PTPGQGRAGAREAPPPPPPPPPPPATIRPPPRDRSPRRRPSRPDRASNRRRTRMEMGPRCRKSRPNGKDPCRARWWPSRAGRRATDEASGCCPLPRPCSGPAQGREALRHSSWQLELACERSKVPFDLGRAHCYERGRLPVRRLVFVDDHRPDPLVEIMSTHHTRDYAELGAHALEEIERRAASHLRQRDLETCRRF